MTTMRLTIMAAYRPTVVRMAAIGELVRSTSGQLMVRPPLRCPRLPGLLIAAISRGRCHKPTSRTALVQDGLDTNVDTLH